MEQLPGRKWVCNVCGFSAEGETPPNSCPQCGTDRDHFEEVYPPGTRYLIIGAGIAGVSAADSIHQADSTANVVLLSDETELPYFRMNLTRYLAGELDDSKLDLHSRAWYLENHIELHLNSKVVDIDPRERRVSTADGLSFDYDVLVMTTGASPFVPPFPGANLAGVQTLRTLRDANAVLSVCSRPVNVVCIGGGLLGLEVAGAISKRGAQVSVVESLPWLLPRQLDQAASRLLQQKIEAMGITVYTGAKTRALVGYEHVEAVELEDGSSLPADLVIISAGVSANLELARKAGLSINRGILVDDTMRTSDPNIYAAGDDTEHQGRMYGLWVPAKSQGAIAGFSAAGKPAKFASDPPSARLKVLGIDLFSIGEITPAEGDVVLVEENNGNYASFLFRGGILRGSILLGDASLAAAVKNAVEAQKDFSAELARGINAASFKQVIKS
ncbi:MAG TPA: FAD-dependent oxidoreductase [Anaerolineaceae bacterium]|jgi:nitrite reductase (NADH) large subunit|nr:FAD-dependent oxidoreductase [Anaerolineaceae bacterium]NMD27181.1 FAD-dependent oxidoreductase [Chloroflexota bacterium]HOA21875.1 FAD-dependent oxidoreductase [Anaerolineaceae bacterium]HOG77565.1 FAD-dependent oxidoreductase [Anaerolineaceae bacterium]